jgi:quinol monooxygenase YgiN
MLIVTGRVHARPDTLADVLTASLEHVHRSRTEPGCLLHSVHQSVEDPLLVVFVEHWADREALSTHFAQPGSNEFVRAVATLADERPTLEIYEATKIRL